MNKKLLCAALLGSLGLAQAASAQEFDDRWYVSGSTGVNFQDTDRNTEDSMFATLGFGKFLNPNFSLEAELNYQNPDKTANPNLWWSQYGVSVDGRYHFRNVDAKWWPYLRGGIGWQRHEEEYDAFPNPISPGQHEASNLALNLGAGPDIERHGNKAEAGHQRGHQHWPKPGQRPFADRAVEGCAFRNQTADEGHHDHAIQHRYARKRDEAHPGRDRER